MQREDCFMDVIGQGPDRHLIDGEQFVSVGDQPDFQRMMENLRLADRLRGCLRG